MSWIVDWKMRREAVDRKEEEILKHEMKRNTAW
jgi:hypothetical protein